MIRFKVGDRVFHEWGFGSGEVVEVLEDGYLVRYDLTPPPRYNVNYNSDLTFSEILQKGEERKI